MQRIPGPCHPKRFGFHCAVLAAPATPFSRIDQIYPIYPIYPSQSVKSIPPSISRHLEGMAAEVRVHPHRELPALHLDHSKDQTWPMQLDGPDGQHAYSLKASLQCGQWPYFVAVCERGWSDADIQVFFAIQVDEELNFLLGAKPSDPSLGSAQQHWPFQ
mmetsp:Transcript_39428/g.85038  ORF Transcript_39428/g.85038 Transcript_39428/m.85038 type:complete len:160 (+) Transcript_39428:1070-1549(+)